jgi:hypothetical protein
MRGMQYLYNGHNAPIPTIQFEAYREGADDYRYLSMIDRRLQLLEGKHLTPGGEQVVASARDLVDNVPAPFAGWRRNDFTVTQRLTGADWAVLRARMQDLVVKLDALAHP